MRLFCPGSLRCMLHLRKQLPSFRCFASISSKRPVKSVEPTENETTETENAKERKKSSRKFDAHTYSIWAKEMAKRGKPEEALSLLENVITKRRVNQLKIVDGGEQVIRDPKPSQVIFNTAIDVCGHAGKFNRAWSLFNDMKKRGLKAEERTVASLLNALAENIQSRPESQLDSNRIWDKALQLYNKAEGADAKSTFLLNGILKVASRLEEIERMRQVLPLKALPKEADEISFTLALNLLARSGGRMEEAAAYFEALETRLGGKVSWRPVAAVLTLIRRDVMKMDPAVKTVDLRNDQAALAMKYFGKLNLQQQQQQTDGSKQVQSPPIIISTLLLEIFTKLHAWPHALSFVSTWILPTALSQSTTSLKTIREHVDSYLLSLALKCLANGPEPREACKQTFAAFEKLLAKGFAPSTNDINGLLMVCSRAGLEGRADAFFRAHFRKKHAVLRPDQHTIYHLMAALHSNADPAYTKDIRDHWQWLQQTHQKLYDECKASPRFSRFQKMLA